MIHANLQIHNRTHATAIFNRYTLSVFLFIISIYGCFAIHNGCTAPFLLPHKPFMVVWNHPTSVCEKHGIIIDFARWGIVVNSRDSFVGDQISLLYRPGLWPYYFQNDAYNGGIPQLGNESSHIQSLKAVIGSEIPNQNFSGLGVIDFEKWRPLYSLNFDNLKIYQEKSLELAKQRHPSYNKSEVLKKAVKEFEQAARSYIEGSLKTAKAKRPYGQWGFYGYPRCWDTNCNGSTISKNDRMNWVFAASSGLYPSIYFYRSSPPAARADMITKRLMETLRVKAMWAPTDAAIFPYSLSQDGPYSFFTQNDLNYSIKLPADLGSSGVILWGSSAMTHAKNECLLLQDYVKSTLGPYSKQVMDFSSNCSVQLCSGHGRCVRKHYETVYQSHLARSAGNQMCVISPRRLQTKGKDFDRGRENHIKSSFEKGEVYNSKEIVFGFAAKGSSFTKTLNSNVFGRWSEAPFTKRRRSDIKQEEVGRYLETLLNGIQQAFMRFFSNFKGLIKRLSINSNDTDTKFKNGENNSLLYSSGNIADRTRPLAHEMRIQTNSQSNYNQQKRNVNSFLFMEDFDDYVCNCLAGWSGPHCDLRQSKPAK